MAGKKSHDATKNLEPDQPTQVTEKGLKIGLPKRREVMDMLTRLSGGRSSKP